MTTQRTLEVRKEILAMKHKDLDTLIQEKIKKRAPTHELTSLKRKKLRVKEELLDIQTKLGEAQ